MADEVTTDIWELLADERVKEVTLVRTDVPKFRHLFVMYINRHYKGGMAANTVTRKVHGRVKEDK